MKMRNVIVVFSAIILLAIIAFIFCPPSHTSAASSDPIGMAVTQAGRICLSGESVQDKRSIELDLKAGLHAFGKGMGDSEQTRKYINDAVDKVDALKDREATRTCMKEQTAVFLVYLDTHKLTPQQVDAVAATDPQLSGGAIGYIYYEENNGKPTEAGPFRRISAQPANPRYADLKAGDILKSVRAANIRSGPTGNDDVVRKINAAQCLKTLEAPTHPMSDLLSATSGGRIQVQAISCPEV